MDTWSDVVMAIAFATTAVRIILDFRQRRAEVRITRDTAERSLEETQPAYTGERGATRRDIQRLTDSIEQMQAESTRAEHRQNFVTAASLSIGAAIATAVSVALSNTFNWLWGGAIIVLLVIGLVMAHLGRPRP